MSARLHTVRDFVNLKKLQEKLRSEDSKSNFLKFTKSLKYCMARSNAKLGVDVGKSSNGKMALRGPIYCHSTWACPSCTPRAMMHIANQLKAGYQMLRERGYEARMITFTVPHYKFAYKVNNAFPLKLSSVFNLLKATYCSFQNSKLKRARPSDCYTFQIFEVTHGNRNGWHPHIHAIYWMHKDDWASFLEKEAELSLAWNRICSQQIDKLNDSGVLDDVEYKNLHRVLSRTKEPGIFISKHTEEVIRYITDALVQEVTSLHLKQAKSDNLTIWQILDLALKNNDEQCWKLYLEYVAATRRLQRWRFQRGFVAEITEYRKLHPDIKFQKKRQAEASVTVTQVCWFTSLSWSSLNVKCPNAIPIMARIIRRWNADEAYTLICRLCKKYAVPVPLRQNPMHAGLAASDQWAA